MSDTIGGAIKTIDNVIAELEGVKAQHAEDMDGVIADLNIVKEDHAGDMTALTVALARSQAALRECEASKPVDPPVIPPVLPPDPPVIPPDPPIIVPPDPPAGERPGEDLDWNVQSVPTHLHWVVRGNVAVHQATQRAIDLDTGGLGDAYRFSRQHGDEGMVIFGILGRAGLAALGGRYGTTSSDDLVYPGEEYPSAGFVGLTPDAEVQLSFNFANNRAIEVGNVGAWNIGCRGASDSFVIRTDGKKDCKDVTFDGCWWLGPEGSNYASGLHISGWDRFVMRNHLWRGKNPDDPGLRFREHSLVYLKHGRISTLVDGCDLYGGNRTGFQKRPQPFLMDTEGNVHPKNPLPTDRFMVRDNYGLNLGDNWGPHQSDGGAAMTIWVSAAGLYVYDNHVNNFRYKALSILGQGDYRNDPRKATRLYDHLASGNQHDKVYVSGNMFVPGPLTQRGTVEFCACDLVHVSGNNHFVGKVVFNGRTNNTYNGLRNVEQKILTRTGRPNWDIQTVTEDGRGERPMTEAEVDSMLVRA